MIKIKNDWAQTLYKANIVFRPPRSFVMGLLFSLYNLAFIASPYWLLPKSTTGVIAALSLTLVIGLAWSYFSAAKVQVGLSITGLLALILLIAGTILLNAQALRYDIPWKGDESFHINQSLRIVDLIPPGWLKAYLALWAVFLYISWKMPKWAALAGAGWVAVLVFVYADSGLMPKDPGFLLRYPFVNYLVVSIPPLLFDPKYPYYEFLFRMIPVLCTGAILWFALRKISSAPVMALFLWAAAFATTPIIFYYASIFYLEMPAVLLMLVVSLDIKKLLDNDFEQIRKLPAWYALILIGFVKETAISFLFCFLLCRAAFFFHQDDSSKARGQNSITYIIKGYFKKEAPIALITLLPIALYISIRTLVIDTRSFSPNPFNLLAPSVYPVLAQAFMEQFGLFLLFFIAGCLYLFRENEYKTALFHVLTFLFIPFFHVVDGLLYAGYSRFNLFVLPVFLSGGMIALKKLMENKKILGALAAGVVLATNLWASPVYSDGSKQSLWGNYLNDASEYYYPYQETLVWLEETHRESTILFINGNFSYSYDFYFNQLRWQPNYEFSEDVSFEPGRETDAIVSILQNAEGGNFEIVVYQVMEKPAMPPHRAGTYYLEKVFSNDAKNILAVYARR